MMALETRVDDPVQVISDIALVPHY